MSKEEEPEYREIDLKFLKEIGKIIGLVLILIIGLILFEAMTEAFHSFDEFSLVIVLLVIAIRQNAHFNPPEEHKND